MNKKQIRQEIQDRRKTMESTRNRFKQTAAYKKYEDQIFNAQREMDRMEREWYVKVKDALEEISKQIIDLEILFHEPSRQTITSAIPREKLHPKVRIYVDKYLSSLWGRRRDTIIWQSKDGRFAVVRCPGSREWAGIGQTHYAPVEYILVSTAQNTILKNREGRFSKRILDKWIEQLANDGQLVVSKQKE